MDAIWKDLRFALRQLRVNPVFTAVAVLSLALGIGANTAIFQLIDAVRLQSLPVRNPQELAYIDFAKGARRSGWFSGHSPRLTYAQWEQIRDHTQSFSGTMAWSAETFNLAEGGEARIAHGFYVSADFFSVLGVPAIAGRTFDAQDDRPGCGSPSLVISYAFWQRELGGDPAVVGRTLRLDGHPFTIVGITPASFFGVEVGSSYDLALPLCSEALFSAGRSRIPLRHAWWLSAMGRLKFGRSIEQADAELRVLSPGIMQATLPTNFRPDNAKQYLANKLTVTSGATGVSLLRREYENPLWILLGATGLVLLIACANLANLLLARASAREREIAVRQAIGASRARLISQLLSESLLLALVGTALGALLAQALSRALVAFLTTSGNPLFVNMAPDGRLLGFMAAIAVGTCLLFGLAPAIRATRVAPASAMRSGSRGVSDGRDRFNLRRMLVVAQVSLSLVLLVGALLFVRSLEKLMSADPGFRPEGIVSVSVDMRPGHYAQERLPEMYRELLDQIRAQIPNSSVAQVGWTPVSGSGWDDRTFADGTSNAPIDCLYNRAGPGYFKTMGTAFIAGRDFDDHDRAGSTPVAIVNEMFAQKIFSGQAPVGKSFRVQGSAGEPDRIYQVVGVVRNTKYYELREDFQPIAFFPIAQDYDPAMLAMFVVHTNARISEVEAGITRGAARVNPALGLFFTVLTTQLKESLLRDRLMAVLAGAFGVLAALLAVLGLYGVIAYMVMRRRNEIGVRIALGAGSGRVVRLVMSEAALLLAIGSVVGLGLALWAGRAAASMLYGLKPYDPATLAGAIALLACVALLASYAPARRASRLDPVETLREE